MEKMIFHLGFPRTGTTFIRREVFSNIPSAKTYFINLENHLNDFVLSFDFDRSVMNIVSDENICLFVDHPSLTLGLALAFPQRTAQTHAPCRLAWDYLPAFALLQDNQETPARTAWNLC